MNSAHGFLNCDFPVIYYLENGLQSCSGSQVTGLGRNADLEAPAIKHRLKPCPCMDRSGLWTGSGGLKLGELMYQGKAAGEITEAPRGRGNPGNSCNAMQGKGWRGDDSRYSAYWGAEVGEWQELTNVVYNLEALDGFNEYFNPWAKQGTFESKGMESEMGEARFFQPPAFCLVGFFPSYYLLQAILILPSFYLGCGKSEPSERGTCHSEEQAAMVLSNWVRLILAHLPSHPSLSKQHLGQSVQSPKDVFPCLAQASLPDCTLRISHSLSRSFEGI